MAARKKTRASKVAGARTASATPRRFTYRGRTVEVVPAAGNMVMNDMGAPVRLGTLRIDGREVAYEESDEGVYSHEFMYQRFSTPEALAEELVRQWGTRIPAPMDMQMPMPAPMQMPMKMPMPTSPPAKKKPGPGTRR